MSFEAIEAAGFDFEKFGREFLGRYLKSGYGVLPKAELDLLVLDLIIRQSKCERDAEAQDGSDEAAVRSARAKLDDIYELSRILNVSPGRIRLARDKLSFREPFDEARMRTALRDALAHAEVAEDGDGLVRVQIDDARVREFAIEQIRREYGLVDWSFNSSVLRLTPQKLFLLTYAAFDDSERDAARERMIAEIGERKSEGSLVRRFFESFVESAGSEAGKATVKTIVGFLTGGASFAADAADSAHGLIKKIANLGKGAA